MQPMDSSGVLGLLGLPGVPGVLVLGVLEVLGVRLPSQSELDPASQHPLRELKMPLATPSGGLETHLLTRSHSHD